jgi:glycine/D-amino acid oxidase-like deaminating enzyme
VVIVGAGVIGIMSALYLRRAGLSVFVVEKGRVAGEQSSRNWGWIRQLGRDEAELPIMMEASRLWEQIDGETGNATGFRRTGIMYLASTDKEMEEREKWLDVARRHQLDVRAIDGDAVADRIDTGPAASAGEAPSGRPPMPAASHGLRCPRWPQLAHSEGVGIRENCAIRTLRNQGRETVRRAHRARFHCRVAGGGGGRRLDIDAVAQSGHIAAAALCALDGDAHRADARGL